MSECRYGVLAAALITGTSVPVDPLRVVVTPEVDEIKLCSTPSGTVPMLIHTRLRVANLSGVPVIVAHKAVGGELVRMQGRGEDALRPELRSVHQRDQYISRATLRLPVDRGAFEELFRVIEAKASSIIEGPVIGLMLRASPRKVIGVPPNARLRLQVSLSLWPFQPLSESEWNSLRRDFRERGALIDDESFLSDWFEVDVPSAPEAAEPCPVGSEGNAVGHAGARSQSRHAR